MNDFWYLLGFLTAVVALIMLLLLFILGIMRLHLG